MYGVEREDNGAQSEVYNSINLISVLHSVNYTRHRSELQNKRYRVHLEIPENGGKRRSAKLITHFKA